MKSKSMILIVEPYDAKKKNHIACARGHDPIFNLKIKGSKDRFCTFIMENTVEVSVGSIKVKRCGDVPL